MLDTDLVSMLETLLLSNFPPLAYACHSAFGALHIQYSQSLHNSLLLGIEDAKELVEPRVFLLVSLPVCPARASLLSTPEKPEPAFLAKAVLAGSKAQGRVRHQSCTGTSPGLP